MYHHAGGKIIFMQYGTRVVLEYRYLVAASKKKMSWQLAAGFTGHWLACTCIPRYAWMGIACMQGQGQEGQGHAHAGAGA